MGPIDKTGWKCGNFHLEIERKSLFVDYDVMVAIFAFKQRMQKNV